MNPKNECHCRSGWLFNWNNNLSWLKMKWNDTRPPSVLIKTSWRTQPEIFTVLIFIFPCTGWATAPRYQMIAYSVFPGVDSGDSKHQWSTVETQASDTQPAGLSSHLQAWRHLSYALSPISFCLHRQSQPTHFETIHHGRHVNCVVVGSGANPLHPTRCSCLLWQKTLLSQFRQANKTHLSNIPCCFAC